MFPDRASLYVVAIEDRQYKDYKIHCECRGRVGCRCLFVYLCSVAFPLVCAVFLAISRQKKRPDIATAHAVAGRPSRSEAFAAALISLNFLSGGAEELLIVISRQQVCPSPSRAAAKPPQGLRFGCQTAECMCTCRIVK